MKNYNIRIPFSKLLTIGLLPSPLKKLYYRLKGYKIGRGTSLGWGCVLDIEEKCEIGERVQIGAFSVFYGKTLRIGKGSKIRSLTAIIVPHVEIGKEVVISEITIIRAQQPFPDSRIIIGDRVHIFPFSIIDPSRPIRIGNESAVGISTYIFSHSAYKDKLAGYPITYGEINIGDGVWLASRVFILPGVSLGDHIVVGANSVVTKSFPAGCFVFGTPARVLKRKEEFVASYSPEEQFAILKEIIQEFQIYIEYFCKMKTEKISDNHFIIKQKRNNFSLIILESLDSSKKIEPRHIYVIYEKVKPDLKKTLEKLNASWFSYKDHQCRINHRELGEILREYFTRYGILFESL